MSNREPVIILIDANIILDVLCNRPGLSEDSSEVLRFCETKFVTGFLSALSIPNIVYILRKEVHPGRTREIISTLLEIVSIADFRASDAIDAANMMWDDYEDAIQAVCAQKIKADFIVTRNLRDFKDSPVNAIAPGDFVRMMRR